VGLQEHLHGAGAILERMAELSPTAIAGPDNVTQRNGVSREFRTDRAAQKALIMKDADFGHISWVITNDDSLAHVGCQSEIEIAQALEMNPVRETVAELPGLSRSSTMK